MDKEPPVNPADLLASLPKPPYFARLLDARGTLTAMQWHAHPELERNRYFVVVEHALDRDEQHVGLWLRPKGCPFWVNELDCAFMLTYSAQ